MYLFLREVTPRSETQIKDWLLKSFQSDNSVIGLQIFYYNNIEWQLKYSFFKTFIYHGIYYSPQINKYAFHRIIIETLRKDPNDYAYEKIINFPNFGIYNSWDELIEGSIHKFMEMWKIYK